MLSNDDAELSNWEEILREHATLHRARDLAELQDSLQDDLYDALLCGWKFTNANWNETIRKLQQQYPDFPVVIFNGRGGAKEWINVMEAGAFDLLAAPYQEYRRSRNQFRRFVKRADSPRKSPYIPARAS